MYFYTCDNAKQFNLTVGNYENFWCFWYYIFRSSVTDMQLRFSSNPIVLFYVKSPQLHSRCHPITPTFWLQKKTFYGSRNGTISNSLMHHRSHLM